MFDSHQRSTGTRYTGVVAFLVMALAGPPAALFLSGQSGYTSLLAALSFSVLFGGLAWNQWKSYSDLTIPSLASLPVRAK